MSDPASAQTAFAEAAAPTRSDAESGCAATSSSIDVQPVKDVFASDVEASFVSVAESTIASSVASVFGWLVTRISYTFVPSDNEIVSTMT